MFSFVIDSRRFHTNVDPVVTFLLLVAEEVSPSFFCPYLNLFGDGPVSLETYSCSKLQSDSAIRLYGQPLA